jgi:hypothetical protein
MLACFILLASIFAVAVGDDSDDISELLPSFEPLLGGYVSDEGFINEPQVGIDWRLAPVIGVHMGDLYTRIA